MMSSIAADREKIARTLYSAVLSDVMDSLGLMQQAMKPFVRPLDEDDVLIGYARTGLYMPKYLATPGENPYEIEIALVDDLKPGEVPVLACGGPTDRIAPWGELLSTASQARGAAGCITDGLVRDVKLDTKGRARMMERDTPVECGGVRVRSRDIVFGDADGVVVIPSERAEEVIAAALEKAKGEDSTRDELRQGKLLAEVFARHGIL
jgi:4-hydroxy-4-methyl-2-oxoglutarate aldolase